MVQEEALTSRQDSGMADRHGSAPKGSPVVACQNLSKVFRDFWMRSRARAVDNLSFEIYPKEIFGLLGPNGSGKSTTIKILLGLLRPSRGRVAVFGKRPSDVSIKKRIGYLPEESYLYPFLNARETLDYYGKLFEQSHAVRKKRIDELLDMVGLTHVQHRPIREYSKGMQRRIGLAQALINDPDLLILDEPTTGLDPIGTRQVKDLIVQLGQRGKTVLLSSHLLADVEDCVDRMVILYGGKKRDEGTCDSMLVSHERTTIETDAIDEETISRIDEVLRESTDGRASVLRVSHPRQTLEQKFLDIVEKARSEQLETAGATVGGKTASFLQAGAAAEGAELISQLVEDTSADHIDDAAEEHAEESLVEDPSVGTVIEDLLAKAETSADEGVGEMSSQTDASSENTSTTSGSDNRATAASPADESTPVVLPEDVDSSVIDSLLDGDDTQADENSRSSQS